MTDYEATIAWCKQLGIRYFTNDHNEIVIGDPYFDDELMRHEGIVSHGYIGFYAVFTFASDGSFINHGVWE